MDIHCDDHHLAGWRRPWGWWALATVSTGAPGSLTASPLCLSPASSSPSSLWWVRKCYIIVHTNETSIKCHKNYALWYWMLGHLFSGSAITDKIFSKVLHNSRSHSRHQVVTKFKTFKYTSVYSYNVLIFYPNIPKKRNRSKQQLHNWD